MPRAQHARRARLQGLHGHVQDRAVGAEGRVRALHRRAGAHQPDRAAARLSDAVAGPALRRRQGQVDGADDRQATSRSDSPRRRIERCSTVCVISWRRSDALPTAPANTRETALPNLTDRRLVRFAPAWPLRPSRPSLQPARRRGAQPRPKPDIGHFTLANGLEVVVVPDRRAPVVTHMVWYKVGAADETPGKSGLAHFLEHLMFKGTAKNPIGQVLADGGLRRRPGERLHHPGLHRLLPAGVAREPRRR